MCGGRLIRRFACVTNMVTEERAALKHWQGQGGDEMTRVEAVIRRSRARQQLRAAPATARALRQQAGLTQQDIADALGVSRVAVCRWESGQRLPIGDMAVRYLALLRAAAGESP